MIRPIYFQLVNLSLLVLGVYLLMVVSRYLAIESYRFGLQRMRDQLATALAVFFVGHTLSRGWYLTFWYGADNDFNVVWMSQSLWPVAFGAIQVLAMVCLTRILSPDDWGRWAWMAPLVAILGILGCAMVVDP